MSTAVSGRHGAEAGSAGGSRAGHNRISGGALIRTATAVPAEVFRVPADEVKAVVADGAALGLSLRVPIVVPTLVEAARDPGLVRAW
ncbi:MAG: hypothetical protein M3021_12230 [Actinomycetota bacterium]|nr:hypothetical protein [Actinomycetota bacterium]